MRVLLALVLLAMLGTAQARDFPDEGQAHAACFADQAAAVAAGKNVSQQTSNCTRLSPSSLYIVCYAMNIYGYPGPCVGGDSGYGWPVGKTCANRPALTGGWVRLGYNGVSCSGGCSFGAASGSGGTLTVNGSTYMSKQGATPTGGVCDGTAENAGQDVTQDDCKKVGDLTQCVTSQGKHCAVASSGKKFCWTPGETGTKVSGNEAATKSPQGAAINQPSNPPTNNGQWTQTGSGSVSNTNGGTTTNYNVTNYTSNYGPEGQGGGAEGEGGGAEGEGGGEGEGDGDDQPDWTKGEEPGRDDQGEEDDVTDFGIGVSPDLLDREEIFGGGSCPTFPAFQIMGVSVNPTADIPQWCTLVAVMRAAVLIMAAFAALRILTGDGL